MNKVLLFLTFMSAFFSGTVMAEIPSDHHIQSDRLYSADVDSANDYAVGEVVSSAHLRYVKSLREREYPVRSIYLHALAQGISISDAAYLLTLSDPKDAREFYSVAVDLLPSMPGWSCGNHPDLDLRYPVFYPPSSLGSKPSLDEVATRFFEQGSQVGYRKGEYGRWGYPDPSKGQYHFQADIDELLAMARAEIQLTGHDNWWYQPGTGTLLPGENGMPVFVSLYKFDRSFAVDASVERLEALRAAGTRQIPVIIVYNDSYALPVSRECRVQDGASGEQRQVADDELTIHNVASSYFDCRRRVTPTREWHKGDYHILASVDEIQDTFGMPDAKSIDPDQWEQYKSELASGVFNPPVLVTLNLDSHLMWANDRAKVAAAAEMGFEQIPVVFLFHEISRDNCDAVPNCQNAVCRAVVSAGADFSERDCDEVYQEWLARHENRAYSGNEAERAKLSSESAETLDILKKAAEQIR